MTSSSDSIKFIDALLQVRYLYFLYKKIIYIDFFLMYLCSLQNLNSNKKIMYIYNQINRDLYMQINK